jgi:hypothetical protein
MKLHFDGRLEARSGRVPEPGALLDVHCEPQIRCDERRISMLLLILAAIFFAVWLFGWLAFHFVTGAFHLLILFAVILLILHFVRGRRLRV